MNTAPASPHSQNSERVHRAPSGWVMLLIVLALGATAIWLLINGARHASAPQVLAALPLLFAAVIMSGGFFTLQPNEARVLLLFGAYKGTVRDSGFFFTNPFNKKLKISLRARNLNG